MRDRGSSGSQRDRNPRARDLPAAAHVRSRERRGRSSRSRPPTLRSRRRWASGAGHGVETSRPVPITRGELFRRAFFSCLPHGFMSHQRRVRPRLVSNRLMTSIASRGAAARGLRPRGVDRLAQRRIRGGGAGAERQPRLRRGVVGLRQADAERSQLEIGELPHHLGVAAAPGAERNRGRLSRSRPPSDSSGRGARADPSCRGRSAGAPSCVMPA